jgi:hypothetical protein
VAASGYGGRRRGNDILPSKSDASSSITAVEVPEPASTFDFPVP